MSKRAIALLSLTMTLCFAGSAFAYNGIGFSGVMCQSEGESSTPVSIGHTFGGSKPQSGSGKMACPASYPPNTTETFLYDYIQAEIIDASTTGSFACLPYSRAVAFGISVYGAGKYTCSSWGGCNDPTTAFTGINALFWNKSESYLGATSGTHNAVYDHSSTVIFCTTPVGGGDFGVYNYRFYY